MLYLVGLGLGDSTDITVRGLEIVRRAHRVYLEAYTSVLTVDQKQLVKPYHYIADKINKQIYVSLVLRKTIMDAH